MDMLHVEEIGDPVRLAPKRPRTAIARTADIEAILRQLQLDIEGAGSESTRKQRRAVLRGFRAAVFAMELRPTIAELVRALRAEVFRGKP